MVEFLSCGEVFLGGINSSPRVLFIIIVADTTASSINHCEFCKVLPNYSVSWHQPQNETFFSSVFLWSTGHWEETGASYHP